MEETRDDAGPEEQGHSNATWWSSDFIEKFGSVSLGFHEESSSNRELPRTFEQDGLSSQTASQILWSSGVLSEPIPNGFYSVIPVRIWYFVINCTVLAAQLFLFWLKLSFIL